MVERGTVNAVAGGSIPSARANKEPDDCVGLLAFMDDRVAEGLGKSHEGLLFRTREEIRKIC